MFGREFNRRMHSCKRASELASAALDGDISVGERLQLAIHRFMCGPCRTYRDQIETVRECTKVLNDNAPASSMDDATRNRLRARLEAAKNSG